MSNVVSRETHHVPISSILNGFVKRIVETAAWFNVVLALLIFFHLKTVNALGVPI